jgi:hypothetical protein
VVGAAPRAYDVPLIAIYADVLASQAGTDAARLGSALELMQLAAAYSEWNPRRELAMAGVEQRLGRIAAARERATRVLAGTAEREAAQRLLAALEE